MGGYGSGRWYRWDAHPMVEDSLTLDLGHLLRQGTIRPWQHVQGVLNWTFQRDGKVVASIGYAASLLDSDSGWLRLRYRHNDVPKECTIQMTTTVPNYGGLRWWFICPLSGDRVAKLHLPNGASIFGSRKVHGLAYRSQRESQPDRMAEKAHSLRQKIGGIPGFGELMPPKPKGMHWTTFQRIQNEICYLEDASMAAMARKLGIRIDL